MAVFVDTGAWCAYFLPRDEYHQVAQQWIQQNREPLITTDYIFDELLTLLLIRESSHVAILAGKALLKGGFTRIEYVTQHDLNQAWEVFQKYKDKSWSFTDCTSKVIIERLKLTKAFAFDKHFEQFGAITRLP